MKCLNCGRKLYSEQESLEPIPCDCVEREELPSAELVKGLLLPTETELYKIKKGIIVKR